MKFLITGSLRTARGPRYLITMYLVCSLLFLLLRFYLDLVSNSVPAEFLSMRDFRMQEPPPGFLPLFEDLHIDLFLFSLLDLVLGTLLLQNRLLNRTYQLTATYLVFGAALLYIAIRFLAGFHSWAAHPVWSGILLAVHFIAVSFTLFDLHSNFHSGRNAD